MNKVAQHGLSYGLILIWIAFWLVGRRINLTEPLAGKGLNLIGHEYYRFGTALLLHKDALHLLGNILALYWVGVYLEPQVDSLRLCIFALVSAVAAQAVFLCIYRNAVSLGGSPVIFALIGLIVVLNVAGRAESKYAIGTWYGNWIIGYSVLSNLPAFRNDLSILVIHGIALVLGMVLGGVGIGLHFF